MKKAAMLLLAGALVWPAMPAAAAQDAQATAEPAPVIGTSWSLKPKAKAKPKVAANPDMQGPSVPAPQRVRVPRTRTAQAARPAKSRPNNKALVDTVARSKRR